MIKSRIKHQPHTKQGTHSHTYIFEQIIFRNNGDLPNPVKYFNNAIKNEYKKIEKAAEEKLVAMAPEEFRDDYAELIDHKYHSQEEAFLVKAADVICAYLKTLEELSAGNQEFTLAKKRLDKTLQDYQSPEISYFMEKYVDSFNLSLDEITLE